MSKRIYLSLFYFLALATLPACGSSSSSSSTESSDNSSGFVAAADSSSFAADLRPARLLLADNFDSGSISPLWNDPRLREQYYRPYGQRMFVDWPGRGKVAHYFVPAGEDEITPFQVGVAGDGVLAIAGSESVDEFYMQWDEYFDDDFQFGESSQKIARFTTEGTGPHIDFLTQFYNINLKFTMLHLDAPGYGSLKEFISTGEGVPTGRWVTFGLWAKLNTPGKSDGFGRLFIDGQLIGDMSNINIRGNDIQGYTNIWIGGNVSNRGPTARDSHRYIDNILWYSTYPG